MKDAMIECTAAEATAEELSEIAKYSRRPMQPEEIYTFGLVLCDNDLDRDFECFSPAALERLAALFAGKTGIFDHDPRGEKQTARIFKAWVEADEGRLNFLGEPYLALRARAYMVRTAANVDLILEIDAGIKKEVSVGCAVEKSTCSVCGADRRAAPCAHHPGKRYGKAMCFTLLEEPSDAYEWSFVAVPSQPAAGVTKSHGGNAAKAMSLTPERALLEMERGELHLDTGSARLLRARFAELEAEGEAARRYRGELCGEIRRLSLMAQPELSPALLEKTLSALSVSELQELRTLTQKQMDRRFPPLVQTAPRAADAGSEACEYYKI